jgi:hypothetical protein
MISDFLHPLEQHKTFEGLYLTLALTEVGRSILKHYGIPTLPTLPDGFIYLVSDEIRIFKTPYGPTLEMHHGLSVEEMQKAALDFQLAIGKPVTSSPRETSNELQELYRKRRDVLFANQKEWMTERQRRYKENLRELELRYLAARRRRGER